MLLDLECACGAIVEDVFDYEVVECPSCGKTLTKDSRRFTVPFLIGETCVGGCVSQGWDETLEMHIGSESQRKDAMEKYGLTIYEPDPETKRHHDEAKHIRKHSRANDPEARAAIQKEYKTADKKRRSNAVKESFERSLRKADF